MGHKYSTYGLVMRNPMILKLKFQFFATVWPFHNYHKITHEMNDDPNQGQAKN